MASYGTANNAEGTGSAVVTKPTSLAEGDLMVAFVADRGTDFETGAPSTPSGWTETLALAGDVLVGITVYAKVADAGDVAASDFTFSHSNGSAKIAVTLYRVTGTFASAANIYVSASQTGSEVSSGVFRFANGITPGAASSLLFLAVLGYSGTNDFDNSTSTTFALETDNPTWTQRHDTNHWSGSLRYRLSIATATRTAVTATGYYQLTYTVGGSEDPSNAVGVLLAISDTANGTHNATAIDATLAVQDPAATGGAQATISDAIDATLAVQAPTATGGTNDSLWKNPDKPSAPTISNPDKPV